jgi:hypothetical protein
VRRCKHFLYAAPFLAHCVARVWAFHKTVKLRNKRFPTFEIATFRQKRSNAIWKRAREEDLYISRKNMKNRI